MDRLFLRLFIPVFCLFVSFFVSSYDIGLIRLKVRAFVDRSVKLRNPVLVYSINRSIQTLVNPTIPKQIMNRKSTNKMKAPLILPQNFSLELPPPDKTASATFAPQPSVSATVDEVFPTGEYRDTLTPSRWTENKMV